MKMPDTQRLSQEYDVISKMGRLEKEIPDFVKSNINPHFELRKYQIEAIARLIDYIEKNPYKRKPVQLLFNMATGSGKTLIMAANILYLYEKGYRNFLFFVNSTNIIRKTKDNFLNPLSPKYLFAEKIKFNNKEIKIREVQNFDEANEEDLNIIFTTIQGLHSDLNLFKENRTTFEDFKDRKIVLISDEAHHINAWTRNRLGKEEEELKKTWEGTVNSVFNSNYDNVMLEYTATIDLENPNIYEKYKDRVEVIGVNLQERESTVADFIKSRGINFPIALDPRGQASNAFGIQYTNTHFLIDKDGNLIRAIPADIGETNMLSLIN